MDVEMERRINISQGEQIGLEKGKQIGLEKGEQIGLEKGKQIGLEKGEQIGLEKGEQIGLEKGLKKEKMETTKKLLQLGTMPLEQISFVTGLNIEEIRKMQNKMPSQN